MRESRFLEFKETVTNTFLKTVSAFANYGTGEIMFGIRSHRLWEIESCDYSEQIGQRGLYHGFRYGKRNKIESGNTILKNEAGTMEYRNIREIFPGVGCVWTGYPQMVKQGDGAGETKRTVPVFHETKRTVPLFHW